MWSRCMMPRMSAAFTDVRAARRIAALASAMLMLTGCVGNTTPETPASSEAPKSVLEAHYDRYIAPLLSNEESFVASGFDNFITRKGNKLYDGNREFRFVSVDAFNLNFNMDDTFTEVTTEKRRRNSPYEIADTLKTISLMGGQVTRCFAGYIRKSDGYGDGFIKSWYAPGKYDELMWRDMDRVLAECNRYGVRIVISLIDVWEFQGGMASFDRLCGGEGTRQSFYSRRETVEEYKKYISYIAGRTNYYTGVKYKNDKAILCWELGGEITSTNIPVEERAPAAWQLEIAAHIRSAAPNHLTMDGGGIGRPYNEVVRSPDIDILTYHYDAPFSVLDKPTVMGEFNPLFTTREYIESIMSKSVGMMAWILESHNKNGGFLYRIQDWDAPPLRWPGFSSGLPGEREKMALLYEYAYKESGREPPALRPPEPPILLPIVTTDKIRWRGSAGALCYDIERADSPDGSYLVVIKDVEDSSVPQFIPYSDLTAQPDKIYYYRMVAKNEAGSSEPSNVMPYLPEGLSADMEEETYGNQFVDEFNGFGRMLSQSGKASASTGLYYDVSALIFEDSSELVYRFDKEIEDVFLFMNWKNEAYKHVSLYVSDDNKTYTEIKSDLTDYGVFHGIAGQYNSGRLEKIGIGGGKYLKIKVDKFENMADLLKFGRLEIYYGKGS